MVSERAGSDRAAHMSSDVRATAMTLAALLEVGPRSPMIDPLAAGLKAARNRAGAWTSTQDNLWALVALAQYGQRNIGGDTTYVIAVGGKQVAKRTLVGGGVGTEKLALAGLSGDELKIS